MTAAPRLVPGVVTVTSALLGPAHEDREKVLRVDDLTIGLAGGDAPIVEGVSLRVPAGHTVGLVGESGSGKTR